MTKLEHELYKIRAEMDSGPDLKAQTGFAPSKAGRYLAEALRRASWDPI